MKTIFTVRNVFNKFKIKIPNGLFLLFLCIPLLLIDIILRFGVNFTYVTKIKYFFIPLIFDVLWVGGIVYLCYAVLPKTLGKIIYSIFYMLSGILALVNYIYFRFFDRFMWLEAIYLAGEGFDYIHHVLEHFNILLLLVIAVYIAFFVFLLKYWRKPSWNKRIVICFLVLLFIAIFLMQLYMIYDAKSQRKKGAWEIWENPALVYEQFTDSNGSLNACGFYQFYAKNIYKIIFDNNSEKPEMESICKSFFAEKQAAPQNEMTGILKGKNVIFVLMESIDDWMISSKYTPTIKYMMDNGINFKNHFMPNVGSGYTFNSEFSMNTGFKCPSNTSSASIYTKNKFPEAMPAIFKNEGYNTNSFHFNSAKFYNRKLMHKSWGYNDYYCLMNYMPIEKCVMDSEVPMYDEVYNKMTEGKFFSFYISYSCHLPYTTYDNKLNGSMAKYPELIDNSLDEQTRNALILAHDTDEFFRLLIERLKEDGLYEDVVIIGVTDHYSYGMTDKDKLKQYSLDAGNEIFEKVPFFIFSPDIQPRQISKVTSAIDVVPTILNLFGLGNGYYLGNDAFNTETTGFVELNNGHWYDGKYNVKPSEGYDYTDNKEYIDEISKKIIELNQINDYVINYDYFASYKE